MVQIQSIHAKLVLSLISLLLIALVTDSGSGSFLQKGLAASDVRIVASGDWHCTSDAQKAVNMAKSMNPQLILGLGDYSSEKTKDCWVNLIKPVASITKIAIGNHDDNYDGLADSYLKHYGLSKQFYSFDIKNVHVLTMATEQEFEAGSEQYSFVVNDLRKAANNPETKWIIVTMHHPFYSSPNECSLSDCAGDEELSKTYHPLFDKYGVDLVLQAHVRNYQRSFPLDFNQESPTKPIVTSTSKGEYKNPDGIIFAIVGTGGGELKHDLEGQSSFMAYQQDSKFGIIDMHFSENKLDSKFVAIDGSTMDHFSIAKKAKKAVIERISDDAFTDTNVKQVSDEQVTKAKPLAQQEVTQDKPSITFKLDEEATTDTKAKPLTDQAKVQQDKPSITFKLDEEATTDTKAKPLTDQVQQEQDKPAMTAKLGDDPPTDDKPISLGEEKADLSEKEKFASFQSSDNVDKSHVQDLLESSENNSPVDDEVSDTDKVKSIDTNQRDPFAALN
ncbi:MAG TPA: metallophosphoesterase [Nitrososphaeraceae archaeon]|nr:metallophosphoesterase [Nitrososphaeraceae archaeon]